MDVLAREQRCATGLSIKTMAVEFVALKARDLEAVSQSQDRCAALLRRLSRGAPTPGLSPSLLTVFACLASPGCRWLEGDVAVELFAEENTTRVRVLAELGAGQRERVLPAVNVPSILEELTETAERSPGLLGPLRLERVSSRCVLLIASSAEDSPMSIEFPISESCLVDPPLSSEAIEVDDLWLEN